MRIIFSSRAEKDLDALIGWYQKVAPHALGRVLEDFNQRIDLLSDHPRAGAESSNGKFRHISTRRYGFKLSYVVKRDRIRIIGIFRYQNRER
jgi:plasmid stabilization system protein ParE